MKRLLVPGLMMVVFLGCIGIGGCAQETQEPVLPTENPVIVLEPGSWGIRVITEGFAIDSYDGSAEVGLPAGYHLPQRIVVYMIENPRHMYTLIIGPTALPVSRTITLPLTEEIHVELEEGVTQLLFE
ncbi:MAG: hypothetical protein A2175_00850 [Candidatus Nealsonbacteria bacterium RBG_13_42_11]|uniref:Uncharacterized protein n=1 Tax=Candidatus Nealsonbacteria bacterium RBG_13_42_11 TaxID=1801663 RepID=A0A1G2E0K0_9BACT|nr:MAG: hypothetical protein A2175_00850 [Candidatus Nealsonbacteria bacterium RBG_13_42_11]